ncbi:protein APCDD1-like [Ornithodoros turicata]|uniref:protein APCDD1-like n=1 Tax=Ornithodoros turicata TaxID=34597 RepID=UPI0031399908
MTLFLQILVVEASLITISLCTYGAWAVSFVQAESGEALCYRWRKEFDKGRHSETSPSETKLRGTWVSHRCEVRPGPEFLLRKYHFYDDGSFRLEQFLYLDDSCIVPTYGLEAWGRLRLTRPSWVVPGGTEAEPSLHRLHVVPYSTDVAQRIAHRVNRTCPGQVTGAWRPYRKYRIFSYVEGKAKDNVVLEDISCASRLHFSVNELQLIRVVHRRTTQFHRESRTPTVELYLGDIHTNHQRRLTYQPTSYQLPLLEPNTPGCHTCHLVAKSADQSPPQLPPKPKLPVYLSGEWLSTRCEVRPLGLFLTRLLRYYTANNSWQGEYQYFRDPNCIRPWFLLRAQGLYSHVGPSMKLHGATNYNFKLLRAQVVPQDPGISNNLNAAAEDGRCAGPWHVNQSRDVSATGGCSLLGLAVPSIKYDVVKMEVDIYGNALLFLGDVDTDGEATLQNHRPTSYQVPLIQCKTFSDLVSDKVTYNLPRAQLMAITTDSCSRMEVSWLSLVALLGCVIYVWTIWLVRKIIPGGMSVPDPLSH